jgi:hypothetical protein
MSSRAKGRMQEIKTQKSLEASGWLVERVKGSSKWQHSVDFFSLWDIIAVKDGKVKWIQVKLNRPSGPAERAAMAAFPGPGDLELWVWKTGSSVPRVIDLRKPFSSTSSRTSSGGTGRCRKS